MSGPKPTHGYPSRTAAVLAWRQEDLPTEEIARRLGTDCKTVSALEASAARGKVIAEVNRTIVVPLDIIKQLVPHAVRRGCTANELARRILGVVAEESMVDAVLDDADMLPNHFLKGRTQETRT